MTGYFVVGTLAAIGLLSLIWALLGWLLPREKNCAVVFRETPEPEILAKFKWLESLGLLCCPVIVLSEWEQALWKENCNEEGLRLLMRQMWEEYDGTGTGDIAGHSQCRGVPEL